MCRDSHVYSLLQGRASSLFGRDLATVNWRYRQTMPVLNSTDGQMYSTAADTASSTSEVPNTSKVLVENVPISSEVQGAEAAAIEIEPVAVDSNKYRQAV